MKQRLFGALKPAIGLALFAAAIWALHQELAAYHYADVVRSLHALRGEQVAAAAALTLASYLSMSGYDWLAFRYIGKPLSYFKIAMASFIGYAFSNNIGLSVVSGGSVRFRLYSGWGISVVDITKVVAFCTVSLWLGFMATGSLAFLIQPLLIPGSLHMPLATARPLGVLFALALGAYAAAAGLVKKPLRIRSWEISFPSVRMVGAQVLVSMVDWVLAATVLYVLIRHLDMGFPEFLGAFLLAQIAGLLSQLPGGLGVFETVMVALLKHHAPATDILGPLLAYRLIYYLAPLAVAALGLGAHEAVLRREQVSGVAKQLGRWFPGLVPNVLAFACFVGGAILLFSGATPPLKHRAAFLGGVLPLAILELSHFLGSIVGVGLMLLARGLQRRLDGAYHLAVALLSAGVAFSLLKGLDWEEALILAVMLVALIPCRAYFHRHASLISQRFSPGWVASIGLVLGAAAWLGFFAFKHVEYSRELFWQFELSGAAPRALRATVAAGVVAGLFGIARLLTPAAPEPPPPTPTEVEQARPLCESAADTVAYLALLADK
ncbi:MAG TPA: lysylphosphatidylglycerol synthase domain-containing protein, partial [Myxococcaceae bacterium]|nr:lysylphosphatidylglycerol synthase domain-containing protein [Myxococcaceae bacterium]